MNKKSNMPEELTLKQIESYMKIPYVKKLCDFIEENYKAKPKFEYSKCSMKPGWNIKYKKSGKSMCVIYPEDGYFTCLVTVKIEPKTEEFTKSCHNYVEKLYQNTGCFNGTKWLMIDVKDKQIFEDTKELINFKMSS